MSALPSVVPGDHVTTLAKTLRVLADPRRLRILDLLMEGVQCNCEIAGRLGMSLSLISHHMRVLREARLVRGERDPEDARWIYYSVDQEVLARLSDQLGYLLDVRRIQPRVPSCGPKRTNRSSNQWEPRNTAEETNECARLKSTWPCGLPCV